ncbi:MAG: hypothetical protein LBQ69_03795 [Treponema sp.]|nr:hypothetical protein [Treponema sp.]
MRRLCILGLMLALASAAIAPAQETSADSQQQETPEPAPDDSVIRNLFPRFRGRAVVLEINVRVLEQNQEDQNQTVSWNESHRKPTIPGRPVGIKIVGSNVVVAAQFTPYIRRGAQKFLVAQGQVWMNVPGQGISYYTSMQTIPLKFDEPIYFFPLGPATESALASIEVTLTLHPYEER